MRTGVGGRIVFFYFYHLPHSYDDPLQPAKMTASYATDSNEKLRLASADAGRCKMTEMYHNDMPT